MNSTNTIFSGLILYFCQSTLRISVNDYIMVVNKLVIRIINWWLIFKILGRPSSIFEIRSPYTIFQNNLVTWHVVTVVVSNDHDSVNKVLSCAFHSFSTQRTTFLLSEYMNYSVHIKYSCTVSSILVQALLL